MSTHHGPELHQNVGHGGVGLVVLLRLGERPPRRVDEPRRDDGEHVELLARIGHKERTGDKVMSEDEDNKKERIKKKRVNLSDL